MNNDVTIVDVFEEVLGLPFEPQYITHMKADVKIFRRLSQRVAEYYKEFQVPPKNENELRPYLYHEYTAGSLFWKTYVSKYSARSDNTDASAPSIGSMIKPYLLYSHGICIPDPLPGLLDYFHATTPRDIEIHYIPAVLALLQEYAQVHRLIRHKILIPLSPEEVFGRKVLESTVLTDEERAEITSSAKSRNVTADLPEELVLSMADTIKMQLWITERSENRLDLYFPTKHYIPVLQSLLRSAAKQFSSDDLRQPFDVGLLGSVSSIDTAKLSIEDILLVREEEVFKEFRAFLRRAFARVYDRAGEYSSEQYEIFCGLRDELNENVAKIAALTEKSSVLKEIRSNIDKVIFGALIGGVSGLLAGSPKAAVYGAAAGGSARPIYDIVRGILTRSPSGRARAALRNHFLALEAQEPGA